MQKWEVRTVLLLLTACCERTFSVYFPFTCLFPGTSLSFTAEDKSVFVAGCENGTLVKCSLDTAAAVGVAPLLNSDTGRGHHVINRVIIPLVMTDL